jgi:hypothetical protein
LQPSSGYRVSNATYAPQTGAATQPQPPRGVQGPGYQYQADPVIQRIQALSTVDAANARADAEAARKQVLLDYGDPEFARSIYSQQNLPADDTFLRSIGGNAFSTTKQLARSREQETASAEDRLNKANLFYGGHRGKQLGELGTALLQRETEAQGQVKSWLGDIARMLAQKEKEAADAAALAYQEVPYPTGGYEPPPPDGGGGEPPPGDDGGSETTPPAILDHLYELLWRGGTMRRGAIL